MHIKWTRVVLSWAPPSPPESSVGLLSKKLLAASYVLCAIDSEGPPYNNNKPTWGENRQLLLMLYEILFHKLKYSYLRCCEHHKSGKGWSQMTIIRMDTSKNCWSWPESSDMCPIGLLDVPLGNYNHVRSERHTTPACLLRIQEKNELHNC